MRKRNSHIVSFKNYLILMKKPDFNFKAEELPPIGDFLATSFTADKAVFAAFSPQYTDGFADLLSLRLKEVKEIIDPATVTSQMKQATQKLYDAEGSMNNLLDSIKRYCEMAGKELTIKIDDLKIPALRKCLHNRDAEGALKLARNIQQVLQACLTVMQAKGYKPEQMSTLIDAIEKANQDQDKLLNQRRRLVEENMDKLNDFWALLNDIMKTGKLIHRNNPARKDEYTQANILKRVRMVYKAKEEKTIAATAG
jgi:hypothetical protein